MKKKKKIRVCKFVVVKHSMLSNNPEDMYFLACWSIEDFFNNWDKYYKLKRKNIKMMCVWLPIMGFGTKRNALQFMRGYALWNGYGTWSQRPLMFVKHILHPPEVTI